MGANTFACILQRCSGPDLGQSQRERPPSTA